jgi:3-isopropylmalate dehydrogenase
MAAFSAMPETPPSRLAAARPVFAIMAGDGIGPEIIREALRVVDWFASNRGFDCELRVEDYGAPRYRRTGQWAREDFFADLAQADAVLYGGVGSGPEFEAIPVEMRRNWGMLRIRRELGLFANIRPMRVREALLDASPLRPERARGVDMVFVREIGGGLYSGQPRGIEELGGSRRQALNTLSYSSNEIRRVARLAFDLAAKRGRDLVSIDKANALETGMLWRREVQALRDDDYPGVPLRHLYVDSCAAELVSDPRQFDVLLADNMSGDILSDAASAICGSPGMTPTASFGQPDATGRRTAFYEPMDVNAPDQAGRDVADPLGAILSFGLALEHSFGRSADAALLDAAVDAALATGARTADIAAGGHAISTTAMGDAVLVALDRAARI